MCFYQLGTLIDWSIIKMSDSMRELFEGWQPESLNSLFGHFEILVPK